VHNAATATSKGRREPAPLVLRHGESDEDGDHPRGLHSPAARHAQACGIHFVNNRGWKPGVGAIQVEAVYLSDIAWPVLMVYPDGILWPPGETARLRGRFRR